MFTVIVITSPRFLCLNNSDLKLKGLLQKQNVFASSILANFKVQGRVLGRICLSALVTSIPRPQNFTCSDVSPCLDSGTAVYTIENRYLCKAHKTIVTAGYAFIRDERNEIDDK